MLVQRRAGELWLIAQHDHGVLSGELAREWREEEMDGPPFTMQFLLAVALHDFPWKDEDLTPRWNPKTKAPHDFLDLPIERRLPLYCEGLESLGLIHPEAALWVSRHYTSFVGLWEETTFQDEQEIFREALMKKLPREELEENVNWLGYLQMFDLLSLFLCLTPPGALREGLPGWLYAEGEAKTPEGKRFAMEWRGESEIAFSPFPFKRTFRVDIPVWRLEGEVFEGVEALQTAFEGRESFFWKLSIVPGDGVSAEA